MKKRAVRYARYSDKEKQDYSSIEDQNSQSGILAERHDCELVGDYIDAGISGESIWERPDMMRLLEDVKKQKFDVVIVETVSRLSREEEDIHYIKNRFTRWGVQCITVNGIMTDINWSVDGLVAAQHQKNLRIAVRRGMSAKVRDKSLYPTRIAFGTRGILETLPNGLTQLKPGVREIDAEKAPIIVRIFEEAAGGASNIVIAMGLKRDGVLNSKGTTEWSPNAIRRILENPIYIGKPTWGKHVYIKDKERRGRVQLRGKPEDLINGDMPHLAIIPKDLWDRVQTLRRERGTAKFGKGKRSYSFKSAEKYLLVGKLRCSECNGNMVIGQNNADGTPRVICGKAQRRMGCTHSKSYCLKTLEDRVLAGIKDRLTRPEEIIRYTKEYHARWAQRMKEIKADRDNVELKLNAATRKRDRYLDMLEDDDCALPVKELKARLREAETERVMLEERQKQIGKETNIVDLHPKAIDVFCTNMTTLHDALTGAVQVKNLKPFRQAFDNIFESFTVYPTPKRKPYAVKPWARLAAITGIELFPKVRTTKEMQKEAMGYANRVSDASRTRWGAFRNSEIVSLGLWQEAA